MAQITIHHVKSNGDSTQDNTTHYHKINFVNGMTYYIRNGFVPPLEGIVDEQQLLRLSEYAINRKTNEIIKCMNSIGIVIDGFLGSL